MNVKSKIKRRNPLCNTYAKNRYKFHDHLHLQEATNLVSEVIAKRKQDYLNNLAIRLNNPATSAKPYCSIFKIFVKVKKFVSFLHFQLTISLFQALKRKQTTLIIFLFHIAPHQTTTVRYLRLKHLKQIISFLQLSLMIMTLLK